MLDLCRILQKYLRTFLQKNALLTIGLKDQSGYSICLLYGQGFHPYNTLLFELYSSPYNRVFMLGRDCVFTTFNRNLKPSILASIEKINKIKIGSIRHAIKTISIGSFKILHKVQLHCGNNAREVNDIY